jgi:hypothetical protein
VAERVRQIGGFVSWIELTQGQKVRVDPEDYALLKRYSWCAMWVECNHTFYALNRKLGLMHRFLTNAPAELVVDHKNHNTLDNRKANLRICSRLQNQQNMRMHADNTTGFKGVSRLKGKFRARIHLNGREKSLGVYDTTQEAAQDYDRASKQHFGDFAYSARRET